MDLTAIEAPPPYTSSRPPSYIEINEINDRIEAPPSGLPRLHYAPGFRPRPINNPFAHQNYGAVHWSAVHCNPARKQYENVARRRVHSNRFMDDLVSSVVSVVSSLNEEQASPTVEDAPKPPPSMNPTTRGDGEIGADTRTTSTPANPLEDPELVGVEAAARNRRQRQYREMITHDPCRALETESRSWDFMLAQSADWEDRQRSWNKFRETRHGRGRAALLRSRR